MKISGLVTNANVNSSLKQKNRLKNDSNEQINPSFKRAWSEHASWGANYIKETGKTNFKLFSFPDAKAVFVEVAEKTLANLQNIKERVVKAIAVIGAGITIQEIMPKDENSKIYPMENKGNGIFEAKDINAELDSNYRYIVVTKDNEVNLVKDPYAKKQESIHGWSSVYNIDNYEWKNTDWLDGKDPRRIIRKPNEPLRGLEKLIIEEVNIPTLTEEGTFESAKQRIDTIAEKGIATAIHIMPVENTFSKQWGYDGVDKFAVNEKLGGPVKLKELVDYTHGKGLNVIIDMVPNHMGPDGDYLKQTGPYESGDGQFGAKLNYEGKDNRYVRDWMTNAALWWANEFKVDGIRFDMTKETASDYFLKQMVVELNEHNPLVFTIAEDGRNNKESVTRYDKNENENEHIDNLDFIDMNIDFLRSRKWKSTPQNIGFDSEWDFPFMHALKSAIIHNKEVSLNSLDTTIRNSNHRLKYLLSHDEIGNCDGTKLISKIVAQKLNFFENINGVDNADRGQKAAQLTNELVKAVMTTPNILNSDLAKIEEDYGFNKKFYDKKTIKAAVNYALARARLGYGTVMTVPGPKMYFQGDDELDMAHFKFFREFSNDKEMRANNSNYVANIVKEKGYDTYIDKAMPDSKIGKVKLSKEYEKSAQQMSEYFKDLKNLVKEHPALESGEIVSTYKDHGNLVHLHTLKKDNEEILVIKNYDSNSYNGNYSTLGFPKEGKWVEILNSDDTKYGGSGLVNTDRVISDLQQNINLTENSMIVLKRID